MFARLKKTTTSSTLIFSGLSYFQHNFFVFFGSLLLYFGKFWEIGSLHFSKTDFTNEINQIKGENLCSTLHFSFGRLILSVLYCFARTGQLQI